MPAKKKELRIALPKRPRHYAADYFKARDKEGQRKALEGCPVELQELVRRHIEIRRQRK